MGASSPVPTYRFCGVTGYDGRSNDVVYCAPSAETKEKSTLVYFGGDMQDFVENMETHRDSKNYLKYNLEDTAKVLHEGFPESHVVVIRPAKIEYKTFSCFKNFVPSNNCGVPEFTPMHFALQHLEKLLINLSEKLLTSEKVAANKTRTDNCEEVPNTETKPCLRNEEIVRLERNNLTLIGFSKGTVVLNQFLYEFHYLKTLTPDDEASMNIVNGIKNMYWLDGGHSGSKNTWITSRPLLETLTRLDVTVHIHVTPYQIQDDRRPWIRKEEKVFGDLLRRLGASVHRTVHFENVCPNLFTHFDLLNVFKLTNEKFSLQQQPENN